MRVPKVTTAHSDLIPSEGPLSLIWSQRMAPWSTMTEYQQLVIMSSKLEMVSFPFPQPTGHWLKTCLQSLNLERLTGSTFFFTMTLHSL